jgi:nicotinic acid mononucleotide adenylyltransferase
MFCKYIQFIFILIFSTLGACTSVTKNIRGPSSVEKQFGTNVAWYIGSFDPPTIGHITIAKDIASRTDGPLYITVNHNTGKNYNASIRERIEMLQLAFRDSPNVHIIREPIEGREKFVKEITQRHRTNLVIAVGEDVLEKNYELLGDLSEVSFLSYQRTSLASSYTPNGTSKVFYDKIDGIENISSSEVRKKISQDESLAKVLIPEIESYIIDNDLYKWQEFNKQEYFNDFKNFIKVKFPEIDLSSVANLDFKDTHSKGGQLDAMIRWLLLNGKIPRNRHGFYITQIEMLFNQSPLPLKIRKNKRVGVYAGSFDPINKGSLQAILASVENLDLEKIYISPFYTSRKTASYSLKERESFLKEAIEKLPYQIKSKIEIIPTENLDSLSDYLKTISILEDVRPIAIFGEDVIEKNYNALKDQLALDFAIIQRSPTLPENLKGITSESNIFTTGLVDIESSGLNRLTNFTDIPESVQIKLNSIELINQNYIEEIVKSISSLYDVDIPIPNKEMSEEGLVDYLASYLKTITNNKIKIRLIMRELYRPRLSCKGSIFQLLLAM